MEVFTNVILESVFTVVGILLAAAVSYFTPKLKQWLDRVSDKDDLGIIQEVVDMGVELAERELSEKAGEEKFNHAAMYVATMANRYGIDVSDEFIRGAVQNGWRRMQEKQKEDDK